MAVAKLSSPPLNSGGSGAKFMCQFGNDAYATMLEETLLASGVDVSGCGRSVGLPSGQGIVMLEGDG